MRLEGALLWLAPGCAFLLMFAPAGEPTYWEQLFPEGFNRMYGNAPYDGLAFFSGAVALAGLVRAVWSWPGRRPVVFGAAAAIVAFALTAAAFGFYWLEAAQGIFRSEGRVFAPEGWTVHPMFGYREFAIIAAVGAVSALALTVRWFRQPGGM